MVLVPLVPRPLGRLRMLLPSLQVKAAPPPILPPLPPLPLPPPPPPAGNAATEDEEDAALALRFGFHV
jgi:hypothetical protein